MQVYNTTMASWLKSKSPADDMNFWISIKNEVTNMFTNPEMWRNILFTGIRIIVIYIVSRIIIKIARKAITHMMINREQHPLNIDVRRTKTLGLLITNVLTYTVNFIAILMILKSFGIDVGPILAGAGVVGLAVGFGAQNLVKDVITGFFIIFEDQFGVGDVVQIGAFKGTVEEIGLRVTRVRNWTGEVHIIPNGTITEVTNFSLHNSVAVVDINIAYEADIDTAVDVIKETACKVCKDDENVTKDPEVLGIQAIGASEVTIRVTCECKPNTQFGLSRKLNAELKKTLDANHIEIPYQKVVTYHRTEDGNSKEAG